LGEHHVAARPPHLAGAVARRAAPFRRANRSGAAARGAHLLPRHHDLAFAAAHRVFEGDGDGRVNVGARLGTAAVGRANRVQDLGEEFREGRRLRPVRTGGKIEPRELEGGPALLGPRAPLVIGATPIGIDQRFVRLRDLAEERFGGAIARVDVRVIAPRQPPERPLDICGRGAGRETEQSVKIHIGLGNQGLGIGPGTGPRNGPCALSPALSRGPLSLARQRYFFSSSTTSASITSPCERPLPPPWDAPPPGCPPPGCPPPAAPPPAPALAAEVRYIASAALCCAEFSASIVRFISAVSFFSIAFFRSSIADSIGALSDAASLSPESRSIFSAA